MFDPLTLAEVRLALGNVSAEWVWRLELEGMLHTLRVGQRKVYAQWEVERLGRAMRAINDEAAKLVEQHTGEPALKLDEELLVFLESGPELEDLLDFLYRRKESTGSTFVRTPFARCSSDSTAECAA